MVTMVNDAVSDLLIRLKNWYMAQSARVELPWSKLKEAVVAVLTKEGFVAGFTRQGDSLVVELKYQGKNPAMQNVIRISKPGVRIYSGTSKLSRLTKGMGIGIISTPRGIMSHREATKLHVGGEVLCRVW